MKNDMTDTLTELTQRELRKDTRGTASPLNISNWNKTMSVMHSCDQSELRAGLVDCYSLSRDSILGAIHALGGDIKIVPFSSIRECITYPGNDLHIIVYYCHDDTSSEQLTGQEIKTLRQAFSDLPIIVLSDARQATQQKIARTVFRSGARGFIPTRTIEMPMVPASIRYVAEGGTVVPVDILFSDKGEPDIREDLEVMPAGLTSRQVSVLAHLRQGKPNKIIAHDLRMSESTVKVHIRNIMRKMGATNRTQAVYKARQYYDARPDAYSDRQTA